MFPIKDKFLRYYVTTCFWLYVLAGTTAAMLISDEFDFIRTPVVAYAGIPTASLFFLACWQFPNWWERYTSIYRAMIFGIIICFGTGVLTLANALTSEDVWVKQSVEYAYRGYVDAKKRGGLGVLYNYRF